VDNIGFGPNFFLKYIFQNTLKPIIS